MVFGRFLLVLMGIILVLFSYAVHAQGCSEMSIIADDTILNENDNDNYSVSLENNSDRAFFIESVEVSDNSSYFEADYSGRENNSVAAGADTLIYIDLAAFSVDYDKSGIVTVKVLGHFSNGKNCSFSDIQETFRVEVQNTGIESSDCSDIDIETHNFHVPESDTHYEYFNVSNNSSSNFIIEDMLVSDNSSYFSLDRTYSPGTINPDSDIELRIIVYSTSVSSQQSGTAFVKLRGYFQNGRSCSFSNIGEQSFIVTVDNSGEGTCGAIELDTENVIADEDNTEYNSFYIRNNSDRAFTVDEAQVSEDSSYYSQSITNYDSTISSNSSGTVRVKTIANSVAGTKFETSTLKVRGHFSDGNNCGFSDLSREFQTRINDTEDTDNGDSSSSDCSDLIIESHAVEVNANDSTTDNFFLRNDSTRNFYIDSARVFDNSELFQSNALDFDKIARRDSEKAVLNFSVQAYGANADASGTAYLQVRGHFSDARTCSYDSIGTESFKVNVNAVQAQPVQPTPIPPFNAGKAIEIIDYPARVEFAGNTFIAVTVKNNSAFAKNISFGFTGFPSAIMLEANNYNVAGQSTKTVYLDIDARGMTGTFNGTLFIQAESARDEKPITLVASAGTIIETENIAMDVQISENKGTYDLVLKIKNNFPQAVAGTVSVDLPSGWKLSGITELSLESMEEKTTILNVVPSELPSKEIVSAVSFTTDSGEQAKKIFAFKPLLGIAGTALLFISQTAVWLGIIVLAAIILVFIAQKIWK